MRNQKPIKIGKSIRIYPKAISSYLEIRDNRADSIEQQYYSIDFTLNIIFFIIFSILTYWYLFLIIPALICLLVPFTRIVIDTPFKSSNDWEDDINYAYGFCSMYDEQCIIFMWNKKRLYVPTYDAVTYLKREHINENNEIVTLKKGISYDEQEKLEKEIKNTKASLFDFSQNRYINIKYYVSTYYYKFVWFPFISTFLNIKYYRLNVTFDDPEGFDHTRSSLKASLSSSMPIKSNDKDTILQKLEFLSEKTRYSEYSNFCHIMPYDYGKTQ